MAEALNRIVLADQSVPRTFRAHMRFVKARGKAGVTNVRLPHYWATAYHEGRGPVRARPGRWLVYWRDPARDPRLSDGRPPLKRSDRRRLTREEWIRAVKDPGVVITKSVGPWKGNPFIRRGVHTLADGFWLSATKKQAGDLLEGLLDRKLGFRGAGPGGQERTLPTVRGKIR